MASKKHCGSCTGGHQPDLQQQEQDIGKALLEVGRMRGHPFGSSTRASAKSCLGRSEFPNTDFHCHSRKTGPTADSFTLRGKDDRLHLILEVKNQGTNDVRLEEGGGASKAAVERLENVIGFRSHMLTETILPFAASGTDAISRAGPTFWTGSARRRCSVGSTSPTFTVRVRREVRSGQFLLSTGAMDGRGDGGGHVRYPNRAYYLSKYGEDGFVLRDAAIRRT